MSLTMAQLQLAPVMEQRARELELAFPGLIRFVSGRRSVQAQAIAMAGNHLLDPTGYLVRQYVRAAEFLGALAAHPGADTVDEVTELFFDLMTATPGLIKTPHFEGNAVDPKRMEDTTGKPTPDGQRVIDWIKACPDTVDFRTREGNLRRWHWACRPTPS